MSLMHWGDLSNLKELSQPMTRLFLILFLFSLSPCSFADSIKELCRDTVLQSAYLVDLGDRNEIPELFTDDAVFRTASFTVSGKEAIRKWLTGGDQPTGRGHHVVTNHIVTENGGKITGTSYFQLFSYSGGPTDIDHQPVSVGVYRDVYVIDDGVCKFKERHATSTFAEIPASYGPAIEDESSR